MPSPLVQQGDKVLKSDVEFLEQAIHRFLAIRDKSLPDAKHGILVNPRAHCSFPEALAIQQIHDDLLDLALLSVEAEKEGIAPFGELEIAGPALEQFPVVPPVTVVKDDITHPPFAVIRARLIRTEEIRGFRRKYHADFIS